jgi:hypothetical protein
MTQLKLSATWMQDHLDNWNEDEHGPAPEGTWKGSYWIGNLTPAQVAEVRDRCELYESCGREYRSTGCGYLVSAAIRTLKALDKQVSA